VPALVTDVPLLVRFALVALIQRDVEHHLDARRSAPVPGLLSREDPFPVQVIAAWPWGCDSAGSG
jgi:hypothetical protein